jgi:hypothetical protein
LFHWDFSTNPPKIAASRQFPAICPLRFARTPSNCAPLPHMGPEQQQQITTHMTDTPDNVAALATDKGVLKNRARLTLIGIMGPETNLRALFLLPSGRTLSAGRDDKTPMGRLVGVDSTSVTLQRGDKTTRLHLPG